MFLRGIEASKETPFESVLFALGIRYVGKTVAEKLAQGMRTVDRLANATYEELIEIPEIGDRIAQSVLVFFQDPVNRQEVKRLENAGLQLEIKDKPNTKISSALADKTFVVSGVFENYSRDELKETIKNHGGKVISAISGKLDFLLAGDKMGPAKKEKAEKLGVKIISEADFLKMIEQ